MRIDPNKLVETRLAHAMSQEEAAIATDLSARTIQRIEAGHPASLESTKALLTVFGADIIEETETSIAPASFPAADRIWPIGLRSARLTFDGLALLFAATAIVVALGKIAAPSHTGLFVNSTNGFEGLGIVNHPAQAHDVLGIWVIPLMLLMAGLLVMSVRRTRTIITDRLFGGADRAQGCVASRYNFLMSSTGLSSPASS
jgi:DNA-binding XRE family transcriptional regulator